MGTFALNIFAATSIAANPNPAEPADITILSFSFGGRNFENVNTAVE